MCVCIFSIQWWSKRKLQIEFGCWRFSVCHSFIFSLLNCFFFLFIDVHWSVYGFSAFEFIFITFNVYLSNFSYSHSIPIFEIALNLCFVTQFSFASLRLFFPIWATNVRLAFFFFLLLHFVLMILFFDLRDSCNYDNWYFPQGLFYFLSIKYQKKKKRRNCECLALSIDINIQYSNICSEAMKIIIVVSFFPFGIMYQHILLTITSF